MKKYLLWIYSLLCVSAYTQQYNFINYSLDQGLASSQVTDIAQDEFGYLWVGTQSGLSRFDGITFRNYSIDNGLPDNKIERLYFDKNKVLWVATPKGIAQFQDNKFTSYIFPENHNLDIRINDICAANDAMLVASDSGLIQLKNEVFEAVDKHLSDKLKIRSVVDVNGTIFCGTSTGLYTWNGNEYLAINHSQLDSINISDLSVFNDQLYISTYGEGILVYKISSNVVDEYTEPTRNLRTVFADQNVILGSTRRGTVEIKDGEITYYTESNGLLNANIKCSFRDNEGNMWLGTDGNGLLKFSGKSVVTYFQKNGLSSDLVMSINQLRDSTYVFGTYNAGITSLSNSGKYSYFDKSNGLKDNQVWVVQVDHTGNCLVGTSEGVDAVLNGKLENRLGITTLHSKTRTLLTPDGQTYIAGGTTGITKFIGTQTEPENIGGPIDVNKLVISESDLFIGSRTGLYRYDLKNSKPNQKLAQIELPDNNVQTLCLDKNNNIWIGTINGLFYWKDQSEIIPVILDKDEFRSKNIVGLLCDRDGNIWISTYNGVYRIRFLDIESYEYELLHYGLAEGLVHLEGNQNALYEDYNHKIWVGTSGGLSCIDPSLNDELFDYKKPQLHIRSIRLFMEDFDYDMYKAEYDGNSDVPNMLSFPYSKNHLTFDFIGINLKDPASVRYSYRLVGLSDLWSPPSEARYATYSFITPGDYTFEVMAANSNMQWSEPLRINFTILPPFWQTWWFILLSIGFVLLIIVLIFQVRIRSFKQKQENERLGFKNRLLFLEQRSLNASMNRHFIFNSLNSIQYFINSSDKRSANKYLSSFAKLIRKNLDSSTANNFVVTLQEEIERIELYLALEKMRFHERFNYIVDVDPQLDTEEIEIPSMIMQPFVENSIIHGVLPLEKTGNIKVHIYQDSNDVVFEIEDDGIGIDQSLSLKHENEMAGDHESKGMEITSRRIELLRKLTGENLSINGPFQMNDENGNSLGSKVIIRVGIENRNERPDFVEDTV